MPKPATKKPAKPTPGGGGKKSSSSASVDSGKKPAAPIKKKPTVAETSAASKKAKPSGGGGGGGGGAAPTRAPSGTKRKKTETTFAASGDDEPELEPEAKTADAKELRERHKRTKKKARHVILRSAAVKAGYNDRIADDDITTAGADGTAALISTSEAKRLMMYTTPQPGEPSFDEHEYENRFELSQKGVSSACARETQARCDAIMRNVMNEVTLRVLEQGKKKITAAQMMSVIRPYAANTMFTAGDAPVGLVRHAQKEGILTTVAEEIDTINSEKAGVLAKRLHAHDKYQKDLDDAKAARKSRTAAHFSKPLAKSGGAPQK